MERYRVRGDCLVLPPESGVDARGHAISNFAARVARDADFAAQNGYYPRGAGVDTVLPLPKQGEDMPAYVLVNGAWQITLES
ncbi:MAG: hypothetical protein IJA78_03060 [Clostridia bacterium]|nr:hypothetical protein [Clostridia bacterium]